MKLTLESIRERFPNPRRVKECLNVFKPRPNEYCVGGALCRALDNESDGMPGAYDLASALRQVNPMLSMAMADVFAANITRTNDSGDFETAWAKLGEALNWSGK